MRLTFFVSTKHADRNHEVMQNAARGNPLGGLQLLRNFRRSRGLSAKLRTEITGYLKYTRFAHVTRFARIF